MKWLNFLFGKKPDIFNKEGQVEHQLSPKLWKDWQNRFAEGQEYDWTQHSGKRIYTKSHSEHEPKSHS